MAESEPTTAGTGPGDGTVATGWIIIILLALVALAMTFSWQLAVILERASVPFVDCASPGAKGDSARASAPSGVGAASSDSATDSTRRQSDITGARPVDTAKPMSPVAAAASAAVGRTGSRTNCAPPAQRNLDLFFITLLAGALGGLLHSLRSFVWYVGNRDLRNSWIPRYLVLPVEGALLSAVVYLLIRAGFMGMQTTTEVSPYGLAGIGALMGMFSQSAILKLKVVAETLFTIPPHGADARPQTVPATEPPSPQVAGAAAEAGGASTAAVTVPTSQIDAPGADAPVPVITSVSLVLEDGKTVANIGGSGFRSASSVLVDGAIVQSQMISPVEIKAATKLPIAPVDAVRFQIVTPTPGGGTVSFVHEPAPSAGR